MNESVVPAYAEFHNIVVVVVDDDSSLRWLQHPDVTVESIAV
jgi:hypothetical protein